MKTINAYKTREGGYNTDPAITHYFIIFDDMHAVDEEGQIWQVLDSLTDEENVDYLTFEGDGSIFNYAEDGKVISWLKDHATEDWGGIDWHKVGESMTDEDLFVLMRDKSENDFLHIMQDKYGII